MLWHFSLVEKGGKDCFLSSKLNFCTPSFYSNSLLEWVTKIDFFTLVASFFIFLKFAELLAMMPLYQKWRHYILIRNTRRTYSSVSTRIYSKQKRKSSHRDAIRLCSRVSSGGNGQDGKRTWNLGQKKKTDLISNKKLNPI